MSVPGVFASTGAGFVNANLGELREQGLELGPDPFRQVLAGRVFKTGDVVQVVVIQSLVKRLENSFYLRKVADPTCMGVHFAFQVDRHLEGVPMQATAFMPGRYVG